MATERKQLKYINEICKTDYKSMDEVKWQWISSEVTLPEMFIKEFSDKVDWDYISIFQNLSETFMIEFEKKLTWKFIWREQQVSQYFIHKYGIKYFHDNLIKYRTVPLEIISELKYDVHWKDVIKHQVLTENFIWEHRNFIDDIELVEHTQNVSSEFIQKLKDFKNLKN